MPAHNQLFELLAAERKAEALFAAIETQGLVRPGRTETEVDQDICTHLPNSHLACASTGTKADRALWSEHRVHLRGRTLP